MKHLLALVMALSFTSAAFAQLKPDPQAQRKEVQQAWNDLEKSYYWFTSNMMFIEMIDLFLQSDPDIAHGYLLAGVTEIAQKYKKAVELQDQTPQETWYVTNAPEARKEINKNLKAYLTAWANRTAEIKTEAVFAQDKAKVLAEIEKQLRIASKSLSI